MQYLALIHNNADTTPTAAEWSRFIEAGTQAGLFRGGSAIGSRLSVGPKEVPDTAHSVGGFMRFDAQELGPLLQLLESHPVVRHGGTIELFEMPKT